MKTSKLFTLDADIAERLQNINASNLVNRLLKEHFEIYSSKNTLLDEKNAIIKQIIKKKSQLLKRLRLLRSGKLSGLIDFLRYGLEHAKKSLLFLKLRIISRTERLKTQQPTSLKVGI